MKINILTELSGAWILVFVILASIASYLFYKRDKKLEGISKWLIYLLMCLRFIVIFFLLFFLLSPLIEYIKNYIKKPVIILAIDNSESILMNQDSVSFISKYNEFLTKIDKSIPERFDLQYVNFGQVVQKGKLMNFDNKITNYENLFTYIFSNYNPANIGSIIIASDGLYNQGMNPVYLSEKSPFPIYAIGLGDTLQYSDALIEKADYNKVVFPNTTFAVYLHISLKKLKGIPLRINVYSHDKEIYRTQLIAKKDDYYITQRIDLKAEETGLLNYKFQIIPFKGEKNIINNEQTIAIEVVDNKQKILILANSPHPDLGAIYNALSSNPFYDISNITIADFKGNIEDYNLVILHQIPSIQNQASQILAKIIEKQIPTLYILGAQSNLNAMNILNPGVLIKNFKNVYDESTLHFNNSFSLFSATEEWIMNLEQFPPLLVPFGDYQTSLTSEIVCFQKVKTINTTRPAILINSNFLNRSAIICGEGIWRWRISDFKKNASFTNFDQFIQKLVQLVVLDVKKERFYISYNKINFENQPIAVEAQLYNKSFESITSNPVSFELKDKSDRAYNYSFTSGVSGYLLNLGSFPVGDYSFIAKTKVGDESFIKEGKLTVLPVNIEADNTMADFKLLRQMVKTSGGDFFNINQVDSLIADINSNKQIVTYSYSDKQLTEIIHLKSIFFILLVFLSIEWFLRKYFGAI